MKPKTVLFPSFEQNENGDFKSVAGLEYWLALCFFAAASAALRRKLTFPYRDLSEYTCGLADDTP
jgi:hypothetical protein